MEPDLNILSVNGDPLYRILHRQTFLTAEDLPRNFKLGERTVFPHSWKINTTFWIAICRARMLISLIIWLIRRK